MIIFKLETKYKFYGLIHNISYILLKLTSIIDIHSVIKLVTTTKKNRIITGDRMRQWKITQGCVFCGKRNETRDHLFFACPYTYTVWTNLADKLFGCFITPDWNDTVRSLLQTTHSQIDNILLRMLFQTALHALWRERNSRRYGGARVSVEAMT